MPNIKGIGLQNFRTFQKMENIEFAPITLITGANNAGKSSIFKAIQFLSHNFKDGNILETLDFKAMKHELGNFERVYNRFSLDKLKKSEIPQNQSMYSRTYNFKRENSFLSKLPIFDEDEDLVFTFPIKFGGNRDIDATLEVRYAINRYMQNRGERKEIVTNPDIKSIAIIKNGKHLHWSNIFGLKDNYDEAPHWEMETSIDLKKIIQLIIDTPFVEIKKEIEPNETPEDYYSLNLFSRIEKYKSVVFDFPFFKKNKDGYEDFTEKLEKGKSLFSDYSELKEDEKSKTRTIEKKILTDLLQGRINRPNKILECFKTYNILGFMQDDDMVKYIVNAELKKEESEEKHDDGKENIFKKFPNNLFQTTPNSQLFTSLLEAVEKDFMNIVNKKIDSLNKIYFLPTTRGRNREWFIDEQNSDDVQIEKEFSTINLRNHSQIENFVNFWIGKGEIDELDEKGTKIEKGFKIGKELFIFRDEEIGLTKVFLVNFDETRTPLVDLGYGISQLLPIIMKIAVIAHKHQLHHKYDIDYYEDTYSETIYYSPSTLLIEEPEANLHPSLQSKMAELFIDAASRFNIQFLLETHSEYLIYKFQEYIGKKIVSSSDVKMYYFNHPNDVIQGLKDSYISHVKIDTDGSIDYEKYFGKGFFDEQTNLKLSLLNIQRNSFIEDYNSIKEKLAESNEALKDYDAKIDELNQKLSTSTSGKIDLENQISVIKKEREEKELEFQELLKKQEEKIDEYTAKTDYSKYITEVESIIDKTKIDNSKTLQYLSTGKYLLKNLDDAADFAPVIIQYGRAAEFEMIKWMNGFKNTIIPSNKTLWSSDANYKTKLNAIFSGLGYNMPNPQLIGFNMGTINEKKIGFYHLKTFTNNSSRDYKFGELTQIFELLYYIRVENNPVNNYKSVPLILEFSNYLNNIFSNYNQAERLFLNFRDILNLRNCAGHTYSDSICTSNIINKSKAENYVAMVEAIFKCL